jgi:cell division protein FtsI/penicillin-binding protein 2
MNLSVADILCQSVNIGAVQIEEKMGKERFYRHIKDFGFGDYTSIGLPGESRGILSDVSEWNKPDAAMISFGQSIAVTPIQLMSAIASLANSGIMVKPLLIKKIESVDGNFVKVNIAGSGRRVVSEKTAMDLMELAEVVVEKGTGKSASIPGFRVGGKTGTAQKAKQGGGGYIPGSYVSSFIGFLPISDPRVAVLVVVDEPTPVYWGEKVAAPVFKEVAEFAARRMNIAPDKKLSAVI